MQTIDIRTTQNVTIEYELASLRERALAFLVDGLIVLAIYYLLLILMIGAFGDSLLGGMLGGFIYGLLPIVGFMAYQFFSEIFANGQSWGKKALGIKVVRVDGAEPGLSDYFLRAIFHMIDSLASLGVLAALLISSSPKNQRLGDMTANTTVIKARTQARFRLEDILKISSIENYQPVYPEVRRLSEQDMLLIKHLIARYRQYPNPAHEQAVDEAVVHLTTLLDISDKPKNKIEFLKTLIRDYIVLTR
ncbi:MAG: RDD family protein [Saprospiraceae bacterium]|nr:RDD family protein [Saprospiraceae bacterium]